MAHPEQKAFCEKVRDQFPSYFNNKRVLDVGSLDINGNNRFLFTNSEHIGIDIGPGPNVDVVCLGHEYSEPNCAFSAIISTECFEHDMHYAKTILNIIRLLASDGMFIFTCASTGRPEHGTIRSDGGVNAPLLSDHGEWSDYYKNLTEEDIRTVVDIDTVFKEYKFEINLTPGVCDLYFYGIKK